MAWHAREHCSDRPPTLRGVGRCESSKTAYGDVPPWASGWSLQAYDVAAPPWPLTLWGRGGSWQDAAADINMYVNSPGGSVTAGMAIFDTMRYIRPVRITPVTAHASSHAATPPRRALSQTDAMVLLLRPSSAHKRFFRSLVFATVAHSRSIARRFPPLGAEKHS